MWRHIPGRGSDWFDTRTHSAEEGSGIDITEVRNYLDDEPHVEPHPHAIPEKVLEKWGRLFDIVLPSARRTCCFTRGMLRIYPFSCRTVNH